MNPYNMYIAASAGSGKTYQLVNRFISLLCIQHFQGKGIDVSRLMAITFTRKAAGEFKSRILSSLAQAAASPEAAEDFWQNRVDPTLQQFSPNYQQPSEPQLIFMHLLRCVMQQFGQLQLSTIDSLLERMARGLSPDLGISAIRIIDPIEETMYKRKALVASYLSKHNEEDIEELSEVFSESQNSDGALSSPDWHLLNIVQEHHKSYIKSPHALWGGKAGEMSEEQLSLFGLSPADITPCLSEEARLAALAKLQTLLDDAPSFFPEPIAVEGKKNCYTVGKYPIEINMISANQKTYRKYFLDFAESLSQWQQQAKLPNVGQFYTHPSEENMEKLYFPAYWDICRQHGIEIKDILQTNDALQWRQCLSSTHAIAQIVQDFEDSYDGEVRQTGSLSFADIANLIQQEASPSNLEKLQERIDLQIEHWMLDEFQDTSHQQYQILLNLLQSRAQGGDTGCVFMVGDTKQSIYQFRGGDPQIFINAREELFGIAEDEIGNSPQSMSLNKSYRSAPEVLELCNLLFSPETFPKIATNSLPASREKWAQFHYEKHISHHNKLKGCAEIWQAKKGGKEFILPDYSQDDILLHSIAAKLAQVRPKGCGNPPSCAILVSTGKNGEQTQEFLLAHQDLYGFEGPILLNAQKPVGLDSVLGLALIEFFCWLNSPGDERSLKLLQLTPLWQRVEELGGIAAWASLRETWTNKGCCALLQKLFEGSGAQVLSNAFLRQRKLIWVEAAAHFDTLGGNLSEWITHMRSLERKEESQGNEITIMTIHQAKGLEYDFVFIPVFSRTSAFINLSHIDLLTRSDEQGKDLAVLKRPNKQLHEKYPKMEECMLQPRFVNEELGGYCSLYVAMTRAKMATYIMLPPPSGSEAESFSSLLHKLSEQAPAPSDQADIYHHDGVTLLAECTLRLGDTNWYLNNQQESKGDEAASKAAEPPPLNYRFCSLARSTPSGLDQDREPDVEEAPLPTTYPLSEHKGAAFGSLMHELLEQVSWLDAPLPNWAGVDRLAQATIHQALHSSAWAAYFQKPSQDAQLFREQNIECVIDGQWVSGQIDRMIIFYGKGRQAPATAAHIMDFKTDAHLSEAAGKAHYRPQMQAYRRMVAQAFQLELSQVQVTLLHCPAQGEPEAWDFAEGDWLNS